MKNHRCVPGSHTGRAATRGSDMSLPRPRSPRTPSPPPLHQIHNLNILLKHHNLWGDPQVPEHTGLEDTVQQI